MRLVVAVFVLTAVVAGCGGDDTESGDLPLEDIRKAQRATDYQVIWVGQEFDGRPISLVNRWGGGTFVGYGPPCVEEDSGCYTTFEISTEPMEEVGPLGDLKKFAGIPGIALPDEGNGYVLRLFSRRLRVEISGETRAQVIRAARALRPLNDPPKGKPRLLP